MIAAQGDFHTYKHTNTHTHTHTHIPHAENDKKEGHCERLFRLGIRSIAVQGDSLIRHLYYALLLLLSGSPDLTRAPWIPKPCMEEPIEGWEGPFNEPVELCRCVMLMHTFVCVCSVYRDLHVYKYIHTYIFKFIYMHIHIYI